MPSSKSIMEILNYAVIKYISGYLNVESVNFGDEDIFLTVEDGSIREIEPSSPPHFFALDGSSRSFISGKGIVSFGSVVVSSSSTSIFGVYPSIDGERELNLDDPFVAVAPSLVEGSKIDPYLFSNSYISAYSITGDPFSSKDGFETVEGELRSVLETKALSLLKGKGYVLVDGPLFPSYLMFTSRFKERLNSERQKVIDENYIGIVKRIDKSRVLIDAMSRSGKLRNETFLSDESLILHTLRFNLSPPYRTMVIGPLLKGEDKRKIYVYYLIKPFHKYFPKFSILRIEMVKDDEKVLSWLASLEFTREGIPTVLALADYKAKRISEALYRYIVSTLERIGIQSSFFSRLTVMET
ncbi:hypothetical protein CM19_11590 [Candidatus Acidianus copahuensis]|uniref:NurA domain-containing protein n=1 Tax=Candidatus Acidianus copahuensis TaxID=1160895 RepID=A0A031LMH0_9CREN|nr:DNA double-strand break repair nuclease NurA [Candidatus Acidianus copahuensis]EZQ02098.1 hypothetical protein CM19_11590 [Candidatus Acidianus copahuensis]